MHRQEIVDRLVFGMGGWLQMLASQNLEDQVGEDAARVIAIQILNAQNAFRPKTSAKPVNWPENTKKRVDIALKGATAGTEGWYGAFELKWPKFESDPHQIRATIVEDATRVSFVTTTNMCANVVVIGGADHAIGKLFDQPHTGAPNREQRRVAFNQLFSRDILNPDGVLHHATLNAEFPTFGGRVPEEVFRNWDGRLKTDLLAACEVKRGQKIVGRVFAWQCKRTRGTIH